jgi:radical SAM/Cys-rich protein
MMTASFPAALERAGLPPLTAERVTWVQVNVGKLCNQACHHCHVDAGPKRTEIMTAATAERIITLLEASPEVELVDLTGGAPELNPSFRRLVSAARAFGLRVIDRCNLSVLFQPGQEDLVDFLAANRVEVVASLPCYLQENVDRQRGNGVFRLSIDGLRRLNEAGYGEPGSGLLLDLVYNPVGAHLPPDQHSLEQAYKHELQERFGIRFNNLITITNMPISRFRSGLAREGKLETYEELLLRSFNPSTISGLMCRSLISIGWDGLLYDCDFNQMLDMGLEPATGLESLEDLDSFSQLAHRPVRTDRHCFGCTAGSGSSCGGSLN